MKKLVLALFAIFVIRHDLGQDVYVSFDGLTQKQVSEMYQKDGVSFNFTDQKTYSDYFVAHPVSLQNPAKQAEIRQAILDAKNTGLTATQRFDALIKATLP